MRILWRLVIPRVKANWKVLAYSMYYGFAQVKAIESDGKDASEHCTKLFEDWLSTNHGCTPKTWKKLLERIKEIKEFYEASEHIEQK